MDISATITETRQFLGFRLGAKSFVIPIEKVREILDPVGMNGCPRCPRSCWMSSI
jgi:chemotaxis signal transduction protein